MTQDANEGVFVTDMTRRTLLRGAGVAAVLVPAVVAAGESDAAAAAALTRNGFTSAKGTVFRVRGSAYNGRLLRITAIEDVMGARKGDQRRFAVTFRMASGKPPRTGTYTFVNSKLGAFRMFVSPVGHGADLQAVFNNL